jgi:hypothetical protein
VQLLETPVFVLICPENIETIRSALLPQAGQSITAWLALLIFSVS